MHREKNNDFFSNEAWMGADNPFKIGMLHHVAIIRKTYNKLLDSDDVKARKKLTKVLDQDLINWGEFIAKSINVSSVRIGITEGFDAASVPLIWDSRIITDKDGLSLLHSLDDIIETKNGYRFKTKDRKQMLIIIGIDFFDNKNNYTDGEIGALTAHEIGHGFQHMVDGANANILNAAVHETYSSVEMWLDTGLITVFFGIPLLYVLGNIISLISFRKDAKDPKKIDALVEHVIESAGDNVDRGLLDKSFVEHNQVVYDKISKKIPKKRGITFKVFSFLGSSIIGLLNLIVGSLGGVWSPIDSILRHAFVQGEVFKANTVSEQMADVFATSYGFGPELTSMVGKLTIRSRLDLHTLNFLNYIPGATLSLRFGEMVLVNLDEQINGYSPGVRRFGDMHRALQDELDKNPTLSMKERMEIQESIDGIAQSYGRFIDDKSPNNTVHRIMYHIFTSLKRESKKSNISVRVTDILRDKKLIKDINARKKKKKTTTKSLLKNAVLQADRVNKKYGIKTKKIKL